MLHSRTPPSLDGSEGLTDTSSMLSNELPSNGSPLVSKTNLGFVNGIDTPNFGVDTQKWVDKFASIGLSVPFLTSLAKDPLINLAGGVFLLFFFRDAIWQELQQPAKDIKKLCQNPDTMILVGLDLFATVHNAGVPNMDEPLADNFV